MFPCSLSSGDVVVFHVANDVFMSVAPTLIPRGNGWRGKGEKVILHKLRENHDKVIQSDELQRCLQVI